MKVDLKYLAKLLVHGVSQAQAANALGCTQGYVSQLLTDSTDLHDEMAKVESKLLQASLQKVESLDSIEQDLMVRVHELVPYTDSLGEATSALQRVTDLKQAQGGYGRKDTRTDNVIELSLGKLASAKLEVAMGDNRVIMHLGGMNMARAPSTQVKDMINARRISNEKREPEDNYEVWDAQSTGTD